MASPKKDELEKRPLKVFEFKVQFEDEAQEKIRQWQKGLKHFWNFCLNQLELLDEFYYWNKTDKQFYPCSTLPWKYCKDKTSDQWVPYCSLVSERSLWLIRSCPEVRCINPKVGETPQEAIARVRKPENAVVTTAELNWMRGWIGGWGYSCPIGIHQEPLITSYSLMNSKIGLTLLNKGETITHSLLPEEIQQTILNVPYKYRAGTLESLSVSWQEYLKSRSGLSGLDRGKPRYKGKRDKLTTIIHPNPNAGEKQPASKDAVRLLGNNWLSVPGIGRIEAPGLDQRWKNPDGTIPRVKVFKIIERTNNFYIQLTGEIQRSLKLYRKPKGAIGFDLGRKEENWATSDRFKIKKPRWSRESEKTLARHQKQLDQKRTHRLILWLNHPEITEQVIRAIVPGCSPEGVEQLKKCRTIEQLNALISEGIVTGSTVNRLKYNAKFPNEENTLAYSKRIQKVDKAIAKLQHKNKLRRKHHNQKTSTLLLRKYGTVLVENGLQNLKGSAKAKLSEDRNRHEKNNAKAVSGSNKSHSDAAHGQWLTFLEQKAKSWGRNFERVPAAYSSQECPVCGNLEQDMKDISNHPTFTCSRCHYYHRDRDGKAGVIIALRGYDQGKITWDDLSKDARQALRLREKWKNATTPSCTESPEAEKPSKPRRTRKRASQD